MTFDDVDLLAGLAELGRVDAPDLAGRLVQHGAGTSTPIGEVFVAWGAAGVSLVRQSSGPDAERRFRDEFHAVVGRALLSDRPVPVATAQALTSLRPDGLAVDLTALGSFEQDVLAAASTIPWGETRPYGWIAREIGRPRAVRAVGTALGKNPVPLLIPCHRVTRSDNSIGGYIFGTASKARLLGFEGCDTAALQRYGRAGVQLLGDGDSGVACVPSCPVIRMRPASDRVPLRTAALARSQGFRPCPHCRPF